MRILVISRAGAGLGVAQRLAEESHNVDVYIADDRFRRAGDGIVGRVSNWRGAARRADLILTDCGGLGRWEQEIQSTGRPRIGFSAALDALYADPALTAEMFTRAEIAPRLSGDDPATPSGVEVTVGGWFNGSTFVRPLTLAFVDRHFLVGDLGVATESAGAVVVRAESCRLTRDTLERTEPFLRMLGWRGPFSVHTVVDPARAWGVSVTASFHYDAMEAFVEGLDEPLGEFLFDIAMGTKKEAAVTAETMIAVRLSVPPWPFKTVAPVEVAPSCVEGIDDQTLPHLFLADLTRDVDGYATAGADGVVLKATAIGAVTPPKPLANNKRSRPDYTYEARRRVYRLLDKIDVPNKQYRTDIGARVNGAMAQLKEWGWL